ncbi:MULTISPECIES: hypothetical protein [unclassified Isoptericola]|uniref:hypothetical protein n=1 Tax=unclassified Isoptericola TaxID=2623355 RepID=UPI0036530B6E
MPTVRVPDGDGSLADAWVRVAGEEGLVSPTGELLLSVGGVGSWDLPWVRVRADSPLPLRILGPVEGQPEFVASDVGRRVEVAVTSEEDETRILVSHPGDLA